MNTQKLLKITLIVVLFILTNSVFSQERINRKNLREKIDAQKVAFITKSLLLTTIEAQQFWPVYNEFNDKNEELLKAFRKNNIEDKNVDVDNITEKEALDMADDQIIQAQKILDLRKKYHAEFKKVLPPKKLLKLYQAERDFKKYLLKEIKDRRDELKRR